MLVTLASLPITAMPTPNCATVILPALLTVSLLPFARMPVALWPTEILPVAVFVTVLRSLIAKIPPENPLEAPTVTAPALVTVVLPKT
ncbi:MULTISPECIES: hypothetical protein [unclassified Bradyrhizobium]|uniref:hypothetical protein n=1 Tax=unclassified Bradyrhizobium TaxID=2631580 RepID=UPI001FF7DA8A|nr:MULTISPECIES: hypothetical protein [unclassified Bradyrhizobium]